MKPEGVNATVVWSGELRLGLGKHFALQPDIGYWKRSETVSGISVSASDFTFGVTALLVMPLRPVTSLRRRRSLGPPHLRGRGRPTASPWPPTP